MGDDYYGVTVVNSYGEEPLFLVECYEDCGLTLSFTATETAVFYPDAVELQWQAQFASRCTATDGWTGTKPPDRASDLFYSSVG